MDSNKRFKSASGAPMVPPAPASQGASNLPAYQPPPAMNNVTGAPRYVMRLPCVNLRVSQRHVEEECREGGMHAAFQSQSQCCGAGSGRRNLTSLSRQGKGSQQPMIPTPSGCVRHKPTTCSQALAQTTSSTPPATAHHHPRCLPPAALPALPPPPPHAIQHSHTPRVLTDKPVPAAASPPPASPAAQMAPLSNSRSRRPRAS